MNMTSSRQSAVSKTNGGKGRPQTLALSTTSAEKPHPSSSMPQVVMDRLVMENRALRNLKEANNCQHSNRSCWIRPLKEGCRRVISCQSGSIRKGAVSCAWRSLMAWPNCCSKLEFPDRGCGRPMRETEARHCIKAERQQVFPRLRAPLGRVVPPWAAWGVVRGAACSDRPRCGGCCCCRRGCCCPGGLSQCESCRWSARAGRCKGEGRTVSGSCGGGTAQGARLLEAAALGGSNRNAVAALSLRLSGPARPAAVHSHVGRLATRGPGTRRWCASENRGPAASLRGDDEVVAVGGRWRVFFLFAVAWPRSGGVFLQDGFGAPVASADPVQPPRTPPGLPASTGGSNTNHEVRARTGDPRWLLKRCRRRRLVRWRGTVSCIGAVSRALRIALKAAEVLLVMVRALLVVVRVSVVRRRDAMRRRG